MICLYLGQTSLASGFGAAESVVIILVWYYSAQILLLGAEVTNLYAQRERGTPAPEPTRRRTPRRRKSGEGGQPIGGAR